LPHKTDEAARETASSDTSVGLPPPAADNDNANADPVTDTQSNPRATWVSTVSLGNLKPSEVRERTGFEDVRELFFVTVVFGGEPNRMTETTSYLTMDGEWFFYFDVAYGQSANRWCDYDAEGAAVGLP
jgi:hypothetical protein